MHEAQLGRIHRFPSLIWLMLMALPNPQVEGPWEGIWRRGLWEGLNEVVMVGP